ncbi:hypothetical protein FJT64_015899 [Amphibalanus amphitrite]|uniref:Uncharacterized protein n=1 Tax=Amphibalanus amphitrite TaxID=1232801 RepID=A0A6A4X2R1_AMPAM|nr:hypothetical protein FJT64_015899 [Amphibalanus amphitrite]
MKCLLLLLLAVTLAAATTYNSPPEQQSINQIEPQINTLSDKLSEVKLEESMDEAMSVARLRLRKVQVTCIGCVFGKRSCTAVDKPDMRLKK